MIFGERVRQLREMHGLTQLGLVDRMPDLTQSQLSRIEKGLSQPDGETTALLAATLGVTVDFFTRDPTPELAGHSPQLRSRSRLTQRSKASALQWARLIHEEHKRMRAHGSAIPVRLESAYGLSPQEAARAMREIMGFTPNQPLPYLVLAIERTGVTILGLPLAENSLDAFCAWYEKEPLIGLLDGVPGDRLRFSVAHELGHLLLHKDRAAGRDIEAEADLFAAELLTPLHALAGEMPKRLTLSGLAMLKTRWGVSIKSLVRRARELGVIDQERATGLYRQISARGLEPRRTRSRAARKAKVIA